MQNYLSTARDLLSKASDGDDLKAPLIAAFPDFYRTVKGASPSGPLWEAYKTNLSVDAQMLRTIVMPPGSPPRAVAALRKAVAALNDDKAYAADAMTAIQFVPHYTVDADLDRQVRQQLSVSPEMRRFLTAYMKAGK